MPIQSERDLLEVYKSAKEKSQELKELLKKSDAETRQAEDALLEHLEAKDATSTAKYESVGYATLLPPRLFASCTKENEPELFTFLTHEGRGDMVKQTVHSSSLSSYVWELIEEGKEVPEYISYFLKRTLRLYV